MGANKTELSAVREALYRDIRAVLESARSSAYLNHINRVGDVMAEARGGVEDRRLKDSHVRAFEQGAWSVGAGVFQRALTSRELKLKTKGANIAGLQLADLLGHPVKNLVRSIATSMTDG